MADVNQDGWLDLVCPNYNTGSSRSTLSRIYLGGPDGFPAERMFTLPTNSGAGSLVTDFNQDGYTDILLVCHRSEGDPNRIGSFGDHVTDSFLYWEGRTVFGQTGDWEYPPGDPTTTRVSTWATSTIAVMNTTTSPPRTSMATRFPTALPGRPRRHTEAGCACRCAPPPRPGGWRRLPGWVLGAPAPTTSSREPYAVPILPTRRCNIGLFSIQQQRGPCLLFWRRLLLFSIKGVPTVRVITILCGVTLGLIWNSPAEIEEESFNYDESKVPAYTLPDPLLTSSGSKITHIETWRRLRRVEILKLFETHVYGRSPGRPRRTAHKVSVDPSALGGKATRKQVSIFFKDDKTGPSINLLIYLPNSEKEAVPAFLGLNFNGNHSIHPDPGITLSDQWMRPLQRGRNRRR